MAIRKPVKLRQPSARAERDESRWPYPVAEQTVQVRQDGSIVIPPGLAQMVAPEVGESVTLRVLSDGHIEADSLSGRARAPENSAVGALSTDEFIERLKREASTDAR